MSYTYACGPSLTFKRKTRILIYCICFPLSLVFPGLILFPLGVLLDVKRYRNYYYHSWMPEELMTEEDKRLRDIVEKEIAE